MGLVLWICWSQLGHLLDLFGTFDSRWLMIQVLQTGQQDGKQREDNTSGAHCLRALKTTLTRVKTLDKSGGVDQIASAQFATDQFVELFDWSSGPNASAVGHSAPKSPGICHTNYVFINKQRSQWPLGRGRLSPTFSTF